jgi:hypothetical protein
MRSIRVLKAHREAVLKAIPDNAWLLQEKPNEFAARVAEAVLTAGDRLEYIVVTSDYVAFGPYASRATATKMILKGLAAHRPGTDAMVLPMHPSPTVADLKNPEHHVIKSDYEQLELFSMEEL